MNSPGDIGALTPEVGGPRMISPGAPDFPKPRTRKMLALPLALTGVFLAFIFVSRVHANLRLAWTFFGVALVLFVWQLVLFVLAERKAIKFEWEFVAARSHYVQAAVHFSIYAYWGWYWRNVYAEAPLILAQLVFLYIVDGLLSWSRGQTWRLGFGPWPIVFSTNLFLWFRDDWFIFQFLMVASGALGKQFIRWKRDGKLTHIFNPSAFALTLFSLVLIFTGTTDHTWGEQIANTQARPPHIYLEIFLCGLVVQYFFSVTLLTFSAAAVLSVLSLAYTHATGVYLFIDTNLPIAVFLGLHLLMTDPATSPRSSLGRIIFGSLYGAGVFVAFIVFEAIKVPTFYDKLVLVPILNLLTPALDRLAALGAAGKFSRWEKLDGHPRKLNLGYMACWTALFLVMLTTDFVEAPHPGATIGFWKMAAEEKRPRAAKILPLMLNEFASQNLDDPSLPLTTVGANGAQSREQALGILCNQVGSIYAEGKLVPADPAKAAHFFDKACQFGNLDGCANLSIQYLVQNKSEPGADIDRALSSLEKISLQSTNGLVAYLVGYSYDIGRGHSVDKAKARQFYEKGAALGDLLACKNLGRMQFLGDGGPADHASAAIWLQKAADAQDGPSCLYLAKLYHSGDGVPRDEQRAVALLEQACRLGVQPACQLLQQNKREAP